MTTIMKMPASYVDVSKEEMEYEGGTAYPAGAVIWDKYLKNCFIGACIGLGSASMVLPPLALPASITSAVTAVYQWAADKNREYCARQNAIY